MDIEEEIAAYFINNTLVDNPYVITQVESAILQRKAQIFDAITENFPIAMGKQASKQDRQSVDLQRDPSLTYGEIEFQSFAEILLTIQARYGGLPEGGIFYDLGSGTGKALIAAALLSNFSECRGIEILPSLHSLGLKLTEAYSEKFIKFVLSNSDLWTITPRLINIKGNILEEDFSEADLIFVNSTCFSDEMVSEISEKPTKVGTISVSLTKPLSAKNWAQLEVVRKKMSWGEATVYIQRRVDVEEQQRLRAEFGRALDS